MPQPAEVDAAAARLVELYERTQRSLLVQVSDAATSHRARARLRALSGEVDRELTALRTGARAWLVDELPLVYSVGAQGAADTLGVGWGWTQVHREAVQALAEEAWGEIASSIRQVETGTKRAMRELLRESTRRQIMEGLPGRKASTEYLAELRARTKLTSVTYRNGAVHSLADYADSSIRTTAARAHNTGTLTLSRDEGITHMECFDGAGCGLSSHNDSQKANGLVLPISEAESYPLSHPRCSRSWGPRPDIATDEAARGAARFSEEEQSRQAAEEDARASRELVQGQRVGYFSVARQERQARRARTARA